MIESKKLFTETTLGIILSGGPNQLHKRCSKIPNFIYDLEIPILGICYGLQLICKDFEEKCFSKFREFGKTK